MTPEEELAAWEAAKAQLITDMGRSQYVSSYTVSGRTYTYRTLQELQSQLNFVCRKIDELKGTGGAFTLVQFGKLL